MSYKIRGNVIYVEGTINGKRYRFSTGKEATKLNVSWIKKNWQNVLQKHTEELKPQFKSLSIEEYGNYSLESNAYSRKPSTIRNFKSNLNKHIIPYFKYFTIIEITPSDLKRFQTQLLNSGLSPKTVKNIRVCLRGILNDACLDQIISKNPFDFVKTPKESNKAEIIPFTLDEVKLLTDNANGQFRNFLITAFFTGARTGELFGLKWEDINWMNKKIHIRRSITQGIIGTPKNGKERLIDMLPIVENALKEQFKLNGMKYEYIYLNTANKPYYESKRLTGGYWRPLLKRCCLDYRKLYNTRHTFATTMLLGGEDVLWVSQMLGHSDISTTMRYYVKYIPTKLIQRASFLDTFDTKMTQAKKQISVKAV